MPIDPEIFGGGSVGTVSKDTDIFKDVAPLSAPKMSILPTMRDSLREEMQGKPVSALLAGFGTVLDNAALGLKQRFSSKPSSDDAAKIQANRDLLAASPWALGGNVLGNAATAGRIAGPSIIGNAVTGGGAGFLDPTLKGESVAGNTAMGGLLGAAGAGLGKLLTGSPFVKPSKSAQELLDAGVTPTIGQTASSSSNPVARALGGMEDKAQSIPIIGNMIQYARNRALTDFNRSAINKAIEPVGAKVKSIGEEGIDLAKQALGSTYDDIYKAATVRPDPQLLAGVAAAKSVPVVPMNKAGERQFEEILKKNLWDRISAKGLPARDAKLSIEADLGKAARDLKMSSVSSERAVGQAVEAARNAFRDLMARNLPANDAMRLPGADKAYAMLTPIKKAAERAKGQGGVFTPNQLQSASRPGTEMRDFANAGQAVLPNRVPNSGTADRGLLAGMLLGGAPIGASAYFGLPSLSLLSLGPLAYSKAGSRYLQGALTPQEMQSLAPYIAQGFRAYEQQNNY